MALTAPRAHILRLGTASFPTGQLIRPAPPGTGRGGGALARSAVRVPKHPPSVPPARAIP